LKNSREAAQFERSRFSIGTLAMQPSSSWRNRATSPWASSFRRMQCHSMCHPLTACHCIAAATGANSAKIRGNGGWRRHV